MLRFCNFKKFSPIPFIILVILGFHAHALADSGARPGKDNPLKVTRRILFDDNELMLMVGDPTAHTMDYQGMIPDDNSLESWHTDHLSSEDMDGDYGTDSNGAPYPGIKSCSGRFTRKDIEQVAYILPNPDNENMVLELWDPENGRCRYSSPEEHDTVVFKASLGPYRKDAFDIAAADLDGIAASDGNYYDEIIIARYTGKKTVVEVLNYGTGTVTGISLDAPSVGGEVLRSLSIATGDFNGDGYLEIMIGQAVNQYEDYGGLIGNIIYIDRETGDLRSSPTWKPKYGSQDGSMMDISAGDFDGDGKDDIAMVTGYFLRLMNVDGEWQLHQQLQEVISGNEIEDVEIVSGLFVFDPDKGFGYNRRQLALLYSGPIDIEVRIFQVQRDFSKKAIAVTSIPNASSLYPNSLCKDFDAVTGNFTGHGAAGKSTSPIHQLAVSYSFMEQVESHECQQIPNLCNYTVRPRVSLVAISGSINADSSIIWTGDKTDISHSQLKEIMTCISAPDIDGDTYFLGNPAHIVVHDHYSLDYMIQEPPKHVDFLPKTPGDFEGDWDVINVSAYGDFSTSLEDNQSEAVTTTSKSIGSHTIGGSVSTDVKQTVSGGVAGILSEKASAEFKAKLSYQYDSTRESWDSKYNSREISFSGETSRDDFLVGTISTIDIWRYPVLGYTNPDAAAPPVTYMEIVLQGPYNNFKVAGESVSDWYNPLHQNRNILSYPLIADEEFPADLGSFELPDGSKITDTMNDRSTYSYGGVKQKLDISWTEKAGSGEQKTYKHTLGESSDIKVGTKTTATVELAKTKTEFSCGINFNNKNSWGGSQTSSCVNSESRGITIEVPSGKSEQGYTFKPAVYITSGTGALKVAYAADARGSTSGSSWWLKQYGNRPDPALNLPNRFTWHEPDGDNLVEYWTLNKQDSRMEMRGFFMRNNEADKITHEHELISGPPVDGDTVRLCARIYNFALNDTVENVTVRFETIQIDDGGNEIGDRELVGETSVSLGTVDDGSNDSMKEVWVPWNTGGKASGNGYRFYVTIDPENTIENELHEWCQVAVDDGVCSNKLDHGNNEGYWPWGSGIHVLSDASTRDMTNADRRGSQEEETVIIDSLHIETDCPDPQEVNRSVAGGRYRIKAQLSSPTHQFRFVNIAFYQGDDSEKKLLTVKRISVTSEGGSTWFRWSPEKPGIFKITAEIIGHRDEVIRPETGIEIRVHPADPESSWQNSVIDELLE